MATSPYYTFTAQNKVGEVAESRMEIWLGNQPVTLWVRNVTKDPQYQKRDVDLVWGHRRGETELEVKGDRYPSKNFFFETVSNTNLQSPGCFMYTEAQFIAYHFVREDLFYVLPTLRTRLWFKKNIDSFQQREVRNKTYTTLGYLVPVNMVLSQVQHVAKFLL